MPWLPTDGFRARAREEMIRFRNLRYPLWRCFLTGCGENGTRGAWALYREARDCQGRLARRISASETAGTLAVLGSGPSINRLGEADFAWMNSEADTLALNFWCYHDFVPDFYFFEGFPDRRAARIWLDRVNGRAESYQAQTTFLANAMGIRLSPAGSVADFLGSLDERLRRKVLFYRTRPLIVPPGLPFPDRALRRFRSLDDPRGPYLAFRGSLSLALQFAYARGYRRIVLFGIDLGDGGYFWGERDDVGPVHRTRNREDDPSGRHATARSDEQRGIQDWVLHLEREVFAPEDRRLMVGDEASLLHPDLPRWEGPDREKAQSTA